ncbi:hypothetical protein [Salinithrix halophila]|uniref:Uncharacterized protein n=1 Tax=Salinithrix halophila TaxID=1485204 RepID=A0ABV8JHX3_9BACL
MPKNMLDFFNKEDSKKMVGQAKRLFEKGVQTGRAELKKAIDRMKAERARREREKAYEEEYEAEFRYKDEDLDFSMLISAEEARVYQKARRKLKEVQLVQSDPDVQKQWESKKYLSLHDHFGEQIEYYYPKRNEDPLALHRTIRYCERQIEYAPVAVKAYGMDPYQYGLPTHSGYDRLVSLYEEVGEWDEALRLSHRAKDQGWEGDWAARIRRLEENIRKKSNEQP